MTAYTKSTNFATKDTLTSGDPLKIVKGTEINTEFDNIQTAVNSKSDTASPTFTGTVTIPTASVSSTTDSSSVSTGSIITAGGVGVAKALYVGTTANVAGAVTLQSALSVTGVTTVQAGTAAAPAITTTGDTNTGIFFPAADTIAFSEGGAEAMRIDSSGNVGIGVTPNTGVKLNLPNTEILGFAGTEGNVVANAYYSGGYKYVATGTATKYSMSAGTHNWYIAASGTAGNAITFTQAMTLDASGNLLVGTTTVNVGTATGFRCVTNAGGSQNDRAELGSATSTNSTIGWSMYSTGASAYRFYVGYGGTVYATTTVISAISDIRFKENVRDLDAGLEKIMALKPRLYDWKEGKGANIKNARGFIAQEFEEVFPDLIDEWADPAPEGEDPYKSVRQDLIPVLVKAIQEQQAIITTLTDRITALENT
jgi:hypothetical protein